MSHDLRTPLNGIIGAAELAKLFGDEVPDMVQEYLDDIISSGHFMLNLVNDILDTNRLASVKLELHLKKIDIQHIIQDMQADIWSYMCRQRNNLVFEPGENIHHRVWQIRCVYSEYLATCCQMRSSLHHPVVRYIFVQ